MFTRKLITFCVNNDIETSKIFKDGIEYNYKKLESGLYSITVNEIEKIQPREIIGEEPIRIINICADFLGTTTGHIRLKRRFRNIVHNRQIVHYILRKTTELSFSEIGIETGMFDHTAVMHSCKTIQNELDTNYKDTVNEVDAILNLI